MIPATKKLATGLRQSEVTRAFIAFVIDSAEIGGQIRISRNALHTAVQLQITGSDDACRECQNSAHWNGGFEPFDFLRQGRYIDGSLIDRGVPGFDAPHDGDVARSCFRATRTIEASREIGHYGRIAVVYHYGTRITARGIGECLHAGDGMSMRLVVVGLPAAETTSGIYSTPMIPTAQELPTRLR
ncbi:hypothetical protein PS684_05341 [Pseudomonas fluorescens]|nr:hypothetical protein PS684_05341 [Pseudomonas fluorescens]